mmetsp:Transcript_42275/g.111806  ORF Transcript_42275/g.111806 Transcript_42275/m.111806 type:complete len:293 (+) Transcript_42275:102-980(+)
MASPEKEALRAQWQASFVRASNYDSWGQVVEAQEEYQMMASNVAGAQNMLNMTSKEKDLMHRIALCLSARVQALRTMSETVTSADMKLLAPVFEKLFTGEEPAAFPIEAHKFQSVQPVKPSMEGEIVCGGDADDPMSAWQQQQAVLRTVTGTVVALRIDKIGLKDAQDYIDPFVTIIVADAKTNILDTHDTPVARERKAVHVMFNHQVYLNISLEDMQRQQAAIFFEFKHYKPKKKKVSTRCWAFMELNELKQDMEIVLEIYHKPCDLKKKSLKLHTEKPLYLHLSASFVHS